VFRLLFLLLVLLLAWLLVGGGGEEEVFSLEVVPGLLIVEGVLV